MQKESLNCAVTQNRFRFEIICTAILPQHPECPRSKRSWLVGGPLLDARVLLLDEQLCIPSIAYIQQTKYVQFDTTKSGSVNYNQ